LAFLVTGIIAVLAYDDDAIHRELTAALRQSLGNRGIDLHGRELFAAAAAEVPIAGLVNI
jgi:hypothetical protein